MAKKPITPKLAGKLATRERLRAKIAAARQLLLEVYTEAPTLDQSLLWRHWPAADNEIEGILESLAEILKID